MMLLMNLAKLLIATTAVVACCLASNSPANADSTKAYCIYTQDTTAVFPEGMPVKGECDFAQYQGNIYIELDGVIHSYAAAQQDRLYSRINRGRNLAQGWQQSYDSFLVEAFLRACRLLIPSPLNHFGGWGVF